jgi:pyridoxal biosynthesis lyase PdxS
MAEQGTVAVKRGLAQMLKGGVIMGVRARQERDYQEVESCRPVISPALG